MDHEWTDKRMDDFAGGVDRRFDQVDERFDRFEADVKDRFAEVDRQFERAEVVTKERFDKADALEKERFAAVHAELAVASKKTDKMTWTLVGGFVSLLATIVGKILLG